MNRHREDDDRKETRRPGPAGPGPRELGAFLRGEAPSEETTRRIRAALLSGGDPRPWQPAATGADDYAGALGRARAVAAALQSQVADGQRQAAAAVAELESLPPDSWDDTVRDQGRFHTWEGVRALARASLALLNDQPRRAAALARLAVVASEAVPAAAREGRRPEGERLRADLRALARGRRANAERVASDLRAAESAFRLAFEERERGTGDPAVHAELESLLASLRGDQGRYAEAVALADRAARRFRLLGDRHGYGRTRLKEATFHARQDERSQLETALATLDDALAHLDPVAEPRLAFAVRHNRASYLDRLGRHDEAAGELEAVRGLARSSLDRVRWTWLAGRFDLHGGRVAAGEDRLRQARDAFLELGLGYDAALVGLELAALYADQGRTADMGRLAEEMVPVFASRDVHERAREALRIWYDAARAEAAGRRLVRSLIDYLERARRRPDLSFER